jgi:DNA-binding IclR family transcriptional regulator
MSTDSRRVAAVNTTVAILDVLQEEEIAGVSELARTLDCSKANVHKHLVTLCDHGFVRRAGEKYQLGYRFFELGANVRNRDPLYQEAAESIRELAAMTNKVATLSVPDDDVVVCLCSVDPEHDIRPGSGEGKRTPLFECAAGRAILAGYSRDECIRRLPDDLNESAIGDRLEQLREIDETGVATVTRNDAINTHEIAAPIVVDNEKPLGAVSLVLDAGNSPSERLESNYMKFVKRIAETLSKRMQIRRSTNSGIESG